MKKGKAGKEDIVGTKQGERNWNEAKHRRQVLSSHISQDLVSVHTATLKSQCE